MRAGPDSAALPGALHIELGSMQATDEAPLGPLVVMSGQGARAMTAASVLERS